MTEHYYAEQPQSEAKFGLIRTQLRGKPFEFVTASSVFSTKRIDLGTHVLIEAMQLPEKGCVLDIGCGYGAIGIAAAKFNPQPARGPDRREQTRRPAGEAKRRTQPCP